MCVDGSPKRGAASRGAKIKRRRKSFRFCSRCTWFGFCVTSPALLLYPALSCVLDAAACSRRPDIPCATAVSRPLVRA